jgi:hypothetical protein
MAEVYRPLLAAVPVYGIALLLQRVLPGSTWPQLILAGVLTTAIYVPLAYWSFPNQDRALMWNYGARFRKYVSFMPAAPDA